MENTLELLSFNVINFIGLGRVRAIISMCIIMKYEYEFDTIARDVESRFYNNVIIRILILYYLWVDFGRRCGKSSNQTIRTPNTTNVNTSSITAVKRWKLLKTTTSSEEEMKKNKKKLRRPNRQQERSKMEKIINRGRLINIILFGAAAAAAAPSINHGNAEQMRPILIRHGRRGMTGFLRRNL